MKTANKLCLESCSVAVALLMWSTAGCQSNTGSLDRPGDTGGGGSPTTNNGAGGTGGTGNSATDGGAGADSAGAAGARDMDSTGSVTSSGGSQNTGGSVNGDSVVTTTGGTSSTGGTGGDGTGGTIQVGECTFHTEPAEMGSGGQGGAGFEDVHLAASNFVGDHLVDAAGVSLYIYGADFPGDCETPPVSNCSDDCALSWPSFDAGARTLGEGLPDEAFGSFTRADGVQQTTYLGWPLYYYKRDLVAGDLLGQGRGRIWFVAEAELPNIMVMRASEENGGIRYLSTDRGYTLYFYADDTVGTADSLPASACTGACLDDYAPFSLNAFRPASPINPSDVTVFVRADTGSLQIAYKGMPLYTSSLDQQSGQLNGAQSASFAVVEL